MTDLAAAQAAGALRAAHFARYAGLLPSLIERLSWSRRQIDEHRHAAFRGLIAFAKARSPWHAERLAELDADNATLDDLRRIPPMSKDDLVTHWDRIVTVPGATLAEAQSLLSGATDQQYHWGTNTLFASGGSSGRPAIFLYDWDGLATNWGSMSRAIVRLAAQLCDDVRALKTVAIGAGVSAHGSFVMGRIFSNPLNPPLQLSVWQPLTQIIQAINEASPDMIYCSASLVPHLCAAAEAGDLDIDPVILFAHSEYLSAPERARAKAAWPRCRVLTCWGASEGAGTFPCPLGEGFHISEDLVAIETVAADGADADAGIETESIYLTNLFNRAMPLLRIAIDDRFELDPAPCACGSAYRKVRQVHGRRFETFHYGGISLHPSFLALPLVDQPAVVEYQIRQTRRGADVDFCAVGDVDRQGIGDRVIAALAERGIPDPLVSVRQVEAVPRTGAGKLKRFIPLPAAGSRAPPAL